MCRTAIFVSELAVDAQIGVHPHEHGRLQSLLIDIEAGIAVPDNDTLSDTTDYETLVGLVRNILSRGHIDLVETVAQRIMQAAFASTAITDIYVRVTKPGAIMGVRAVGASLSCIRESGRRSMVPDQQCHELSQQRI